MEKVYTIVIRAGRKLVTLEIPGITPDMAMVTAMSTVWEQEEVGPEDQVLLSCTPKALTH